ncbi:esterase-like activity of phytase family protein [Sphingomonas sp.]|uniref:esterase-like activity of phytase family protein n=1 Tax=Sphingomonas sp. TaxID=28214 RepID=UPI00179F5D64|nr:esterase-like activity of phytase family protein [Sphingomonas sp.]MBA3510489.1 esterase-like activity of phytase family protein [Sphingomonas sp.]
MQPKFRNRRLAAALVLLAAIASFDLLLARLADREELGWRAARIESRPVRLDARAFAPLRLAGAWRLTSTDPRFGGVSSLAIEGGQLLALTDAGALIRFRPREKDARIGELPDGPGTGRFKSHRDSEALVRDPAGRGWWVAFENRHELWLFDPAFGRALQRIDLGRRGWRVNRGIEGVVADGAALLLLHEDGDRLLRITGARARSIAIGSAGGAISEAAALGAERYIAVERRVTPFGFRNALVSLEKSGSGYRFGRRIALPLGPFDNVEALAVERRAEGTLRLWLMTDDNFQPPLRTLLIALDWPPPRQ